MAATAPAAMIMSAACAAGQENKNPVRNEIRSALEVKPLPLRLSYSRRQRCHGGNQDSEASMNAPAEKNSLLAPDGRQGRRA